jgi:hypothetical protein
LATQDLSEPVVVLDWKVWSAACARWVPTRQDKATALRTNKDFMVLASFFVEVGALADCLALPPTKGTNSRCQFEEQCRAGSSSFALWRRVIRVDETAEVNPPKPVEPH